MADQVDCISFGLENHALCPTWTRDIIFDFESLGIRPSALHFIQVLRSPLNQIASACALGIFSGNQGNFWGGLHILNAWQKHKGENVSGVAAAAPKISYIKYDSFVTSIEYRRNFFDSLPETTQSFEEVEQLHYKKVQLSSFKAESRNFTERWKEMENNAAFQALISEEVLRYEEIFQQDDS